MKRLVTGIVCALAIAWTTGRVLALAQDNVTVQVAVDKLPPGTKVIIAVDIGKAVAPANAVITLELDAAIPAVMSIDGAAETPVESGDVVEVRESPHKTRLLRRDSERYFFQALRSTLKYGLEP